MNGNKDREKRSLISSNKWEITKYSSELTSRGLGLVKIIEQKQKEGVVYDSCPLTQMLVRTHKEIQGSLVKKTEKEIGFLGGEFFRRR